MASGVRQVVDGIECDVCGQEANQEVLRLLAQRDSGDIPTFSEVRSEYTRLFDHPDMPAVQRCEGLFRFFEKHPGQRSYEGAPRRFINPAALDAERCYKKAGFKRSAALNEPADTISTELEFMHKLYEGKIEALVAGDGDAEAFADECIEEFVRIHGRKWWLAFFEAVTRESRIGFYRAVGLFGAAFMRAQLKEPTGE
jgi:TorA maturation chaperone TorD